MAFIAHALLEIHAILPNLYNSWQNNILCDEAFESLLVVISHHRNV